MCGKIVVSADEGGDHLCLSMEEVIQLEPGSDRAFFDFRLIVCRILSADAGKELVYVMQNFICHYTGTSLHPFGGKIAKPGLGAGAGHVDHLRVEVISLLRLSLYRHMKDLQAGLVADKGIHLLRDSQ